MVRKALGLPHENGRGNAGNDGGNVIRHPSFLKEEDQGEQEEPTPVVVEVLQLRMPCGHFVDRAAGIVTCPMGHVWSLKWSGVEWLATRL